MSLLLEALKKAELTKQAAKEKAAAADTDTPPFTRDRLPDITQPLEIRSEDISLEAEPAAKARIEMALEQPDPEPAELLDPAPQPVARPMPEARPSTAYSPPPIEIAERKQAQQLFEAKELDINPRKPFYITCGALGVFALCTVGYFWYQMQPKYTYSIPPPSAARPPSPAVAATPAAVTPPAPASATPVSVASTVIPPSGGLPAPPVAATATAAIAPPAAERAAPAVTPRRNATSTSAPSARNTPVVPRMATPQSLASAESRPPVAPTRREATVTITPAAAQLDPVLDVAFQAYTAGDLGTARSNYQQALRSNPASRDALLGLAAVETRARRLDAAEAYYSRLLEIDPRDMNAQAGLINLRGQSDPLATESRLKNMLAVQPDAGFLHFTLGNQLAAQARWPEAQQAYFKAYSSEPDNADFAFNLAVSLDQMHQARPALDYYRRALTLAGNRQVSFDRAQAAKRVTQLER